MQGKSLLPLLQGETDKHREHIFVEYSENEEAAVRTERWKYFHTHGVWDRDGLYDLQSDPIERHNLIDVPAFREQGDALRRQLFDELEKSGGLRFSIVPPAGEPLHDRKLPLGK